MFSILVGRGSVSRNSNAVFRFLLCGVFSVGASIGGVQAQSTSVSPSRLFFQVAPGASSSKEIRIDNPGKEPIVFATSLRDWHRDSLGNKVYSDPGSLAGSNATWLTMNPAQVTIGPGQFKVVSVTLQAPMDAPPVTHSMLFLSQINEQKPLMKKDEKGQNVAINIRLEVGIHIYNTLPEVQEQKNLYFTSMRDYGPNSDSTSLLSIKIKNGGNVVTDGLLKLDMTNMSTGAEYKLTDRALSMFPGTEQVFHFNLPLRLPKGKYQLVAVLDAGANSDLKVAKKELSYE